MRRNGATAPRISTSRRSAPSAAGRRAAASFSTSSRSVPSAAG
jgi:hypothetical protein